LSLCFSFTLEQLPTNADKEARFAEFHAVAGLFSDSFCSASIAVDSVTGLG
jgi:hypothetical protein